MSDGLCGDVSGLVFYSGNLTWNDQDRCACASWYGFELDDEGECTGRNAQWYLSFIIDTISIILALIALVVGVSMLIRLLLLSQTNRFNSMNITTLYSSFALAFFSAWRICALVVLLRPDRYNRLIDDEKFSDFVVVDRVTSSATSLFATLSALNVALVWFHVAEQSKKFRQRVGRSFNKYRNAIIAFEVVFSGLLIAFMALNQPFLATLIALPFLILIVITFSVGQRKMSQLLSGAVGSFSDKTPQEFDQESEKSPGGLKRLASSVMGVSKSNVSENNKYYRMLKLIQVTSQRMIICILFMLIFGIAYGVMSLIGWKEYAPIGKISRITLMNDLFAIAILGAVLSVQYYLYANLRAVVNRIRGTENSVVTSTDRDLSGQPSDYTFTFNGTPTVTDVQGKNFTE